MVIAVTGSGTRSKTSRGIATVIIPPPMKGEDSGAAKA